MSDLIKSTRLTRDAGSSERRFLLDLLQRVGPDGPRGSRYARSYLMLARTLTEIRTNTATLDPSLMLQESALRRAAIREDAVPEEDRLRVLEEARTAVEAGLAHCDSLHTNAAHRSRANLIVERATIFGYLAIQQAYRSARPETIWSGYQAARTAARAAVGLSETYFPLDVSLWIPHDLLTKFQLPEAYRFELVADIKAVLDRIDPDSFPLDQRIRFNKRLFLVGQSLNSEAMTEEAYRSLADVGSTAGYYLRARQIGPMFGAGAPADEASDDKDRAQTAIQFLKANWGSVQNDERCLRYYLQCLWLTTVGQRLFRTERGRLPSEESKQRELQDVVRRISGIASLGGDNALLYLDAVLSWLLGDVRTASDIWRELSQRTDFVDPKRVIRRHVYTDASGKPVVVSGRIENESDPFTIRLEEPNRTILLLARDFQEADLSYGRQLKGFGVAFNYIGPIADPLQRKAGTR